MIKLNVGGSRYVTTKETLKGPYFERMFSGTMQAGLVDEEGFHFIDRDGALFAHVLNYMRNAERYVFPADVDAVGLRNEALYFGLDALVDLLQTCCSEETCVLSICFDREGYATHVHTDQRASCAWLDAYLDTLTIDSVSSEFKERQAYLAETVARLAESAGFRLTVQYAVKREDNSHELHLMFSSDFERQRRKLARKAAELG